MPTPFGPRRIDLIEAQAVFTLCGLKPTVFPVVKREVETLIPIRVGERFAGQKYVVMEKALEKFTREWKTIESACEPLNPRFDQSEIDSAKLLFEQNSRDLSGLVTGREKARIPDDNDLQIMVQAAKLDPKPVVIISHDAHFVGYTDLLERVYRLTVVDTVNLPLTLEEWRGR